MKRTLGNWLYKPMFGRLDSFGRPDRQTKGQIAEDIVYETLVLFFENRQRVLKSAQYSCADVRDCVDIICLDDDNTLFLIQVKWSRFIGERGRENYTFPKKPGDVDLSMNCKPVVVEVYGDLSDDIIPIDLVMGLRNCQPNDVIYVELGHF